MIFKKAVFLSVFFLPVYSMFKGPRKILLNKLIFSQCQLLYDIISSNALKLDTRNLYHKKNENPEYVDYNQLKENIDKIATSLAIYTVLFDDLTIFHRDGGL